MIYSQICKFYNNRNVFVTGGTGFVGTVLIEKLLRSTNVAKIYVLIRPKNGKDANTRLDEMFDSEFYTKLKSEKPDFKNRLIAISGDCNLPNLGLSVANHERLIVDVDIVFHGAASTQFTENIKRAYTNNVRNTANLLTFCKQLRRLKSLVHVSTAFTNFIFDSIDEVFYDYNIDYEQIEEVLSKEMSSSEADKLTSSIIRGWPNTYVFTKAWSEAVIKNNAGNLPIGIFRPGIVISTYREPLQYWTNRLSGPASIAASASLGIYQVHLTKRSEVFAELVPADMSVAALIAIAWDVGSAYETGCKEIPIYNYISSKDNSITWNEFAQLNALQFWIYPLKNASWVPNFTAVYHFWEYKFLFLIFHYCPAIIMDIIRVISLRKPKMISLYKKIDNLYDALYPFVRTSFKFSNNNTKSLWNKLNQVDKELFPFDISQVNWLIYFRNYQKGLRLYLHKDPLETLPEAKIRMERFEILQKVMIYTVYLIGIISIFVTLSNIFVY
ncbi:NAD binding 4 and/or Sterile domain containing protein [Asbolus verrucosus]|uniref:Fatty acyl-CoA reductase n=1 Tax=Asbolus verrucosus TaxID=1661398 RepID=A0A482W1A8_ASBVE|nr:NAD binding 4 and/or Sterile domain containing protein [Asbolus verrucosus]